MYYCSIPFQNLSAISEEKEWDTSGHRWLENPAKDVSLSTTLPEVMTRGSQHDTTHRASTLETLNWVYHTSVWDHVYVDESSKEAVRNGGSSRCFTDVEVLSGLLVAGALLNYQSELITESFQTPQHRQSSSVPSHQGGSWKETQQFLCDLLQQVCCPVDPCSLQILIKSIQPSPAAHRLERSKPWSTGNLVSNGHNQSHSLPSDDQCITCQQITIFHQCIEHSCLCSKTKSNLYNLGLLLTPD